MITERHIHDVCMGVYVFMCVCVYMYIYIHIL